MHLLYQEIWYSFFALNISLVAWVGREADHTPLTSGGGKNILIYTSTPP
jgi:hypothetical protein